MLLHCQVALNMVVIMFEGIMSVFTTILCPLASFGARTQVPSS